MRVISAPTSSASKRIFAPFGSVLAVCELEIRVRLSGVPDEDTVDGGPAVNAHDVTV